MKNSYTFILTLITSFVMFAEVASSDKAVLVKLHNDTHGDNWTSKWDLNTPVNTWYGITVEGDKIIAIELKNN